MFCTSFLFALLPGYCHKCRRNDGKVAECVKDVSERIALVTDVSRRESTQAALGASPVKCKFGETEHKLSMVVDPIIVNVGQTLPSDLPHRCHQPLFLHLLLQAATLSENIGEGKRPQHQRSP